MISRRLLAGAAISLIAVGTAHAQRSVFNTRVPKEAISGNNNGDPTGKCWPTAEGWKEITGYVEPGDGFRHTVVGRCMEDGSVLILDDAPYPQ